MEFTVDPNVLELAQRVRRFVDEVAAPAEAETGPHGPDEDLRRSLQSRARGQGLFAPQLPSCLGGLGLDHRGQAIVFEAAGRSWLGPLALNCAAPDEGNMALLSRIATPVQQERYLVPLAEGRIRSCFAMTEPAPGAGSDPSMLATRATRVSGGWRIEGRKWFITGTVGASVAIVMARTAEAITRDEGATMFLVETTDPAWQVVRVVGCLDSLAPGGHAEVELAGCVVTDDAVLGEVGLGLRYAQTRLGPARLTHCMRWLGLAQRAHEIACTRAAERRAFGAPIGDLGLAQQLISDSAVDLHTARLTIWHAAWTLDRGGRGGREASLAKLHVAEAVWRVVDRAVQICGSLGTSEDLPLARFLTELRPFRIYDGPTETHRWSIARREVRAGGVAAWAGG
ncbi:MAG: acyl-CoA dehydrogenase [Solirubrobacteraceae bacterium]